MTEEQLKAFIINLIEQKEQEDENFIRYSFFELKIEIFKIIIYKYLEF